MKIIFYFTFLATLLQFPILLAITFDKVRISEGGRETFQPFVYQRKINRESDGLLEAESGTAQRSKRQGKDNSRTFIDYDIGPGIVPPGGAPLCFEREVTGTCRYRTSPDECFRHEWTAYATFINEGYKKITSLPEGLIVFPHGHARVRVFLKSSCCNPIVHFIASDLFLKSNACIVDVRELQDLHPGEIAGIVIGAILFVILLLALIACCVRRQRQKKMEKETVIFGRSLTRSKSGSNSVNHQR